MRLAVLSDVHANLEALTAALDEVDRRGADAIVCLGDVVGYGPDPVPCVEIVRERCDVTVLGNHDEAVAFERGVGYLPKDAQRIAGAHREALSRDQLEWLRSLPLRIEGYGITAAHAAPLEPGAWARLSSFRELQAQFPAFQTEVCFVGHSHRPAVVSDKVGVLRVRKGHRYLIDVGSVGQPRDRDPRLAFGMFDTETFEYELVRVHYDVARTATKIREANYSEGTAARLLRGV
ncbi:MAG: metallophosphoesterase family protein [Bacteroidota bacterium]